MAKMNVFVEPAAEKDCEQMSKLLRETSDNLCDPSVFLYPSTVTLKAAQSGKALMYMPVQSVFMLESLAIPGDNDARDTAKSLLALMQVVRWESLKRGQGEIYFMCSEESTRAFAEKHGFERIDIPMYRMRVINND